MSNAEEEPGWEMTKVEEAKELDGIPVWADMIVNQIDFLTAQSWWPGQNKDNKEDTLLALDFGCGTCRLLAGLAPALSHGSIGMDVSDGMLTVARERLEKEGLREHFTLAEINGDNQGEELNEYEGAMDLVIVSCVLHHTSTPKAIVKRLCNALKPGGKLFVSEFEDDSPLKEIETWVEALGLVLLTAQTNPFRYAPDGDNVMEKSLYLAVFSK